MTQVPHPCAEVHLGVCCWWLITRSFINHSYDWNLENLEDFLWKSRVLHLSTSLRCPTPAVPLLFPTPLTLQLVSDKNCHPAQKPVTHSDLNNLNQTVSGSSIWYHIPEREFCTENGGKLILNLLLSREGGRGEKEEGTRQTSALPVAENFVSSCSRFKRNEWKLLSSDSDVSVSANNDLAFRCPSASKQNASLSRPLSSDGGSNKKQWHKFEFALSASTAVHAYFMHVSGGFHNLTVITLNTFIKEISGSSDRPAPGEVWTISSAFSDA